ncbi:hypothetical protein CC78DRAFT_573093 [Lojkania enalia]|uniref:Uncharacterized protein n=1 Tax=Lojkania enalia TaxID=147567 RepID=A0A9P4JW13_9PLEO|nr:hypothetical protein CC78DRAFT_573093 [Didymosphaeria enalia]
MKGWGKFKATGQEMIDQLNAIAVEISKILDGFGQEVTEKTEAVAEITADWLSEELSESGAKVACDLFVVVVLFAWIRIVWYPIVLGTVSVQDIHYRSQLHHDNFTLGLAYHFRCDNGSLRHGLKALEGVGKEASKHPSEATSEAGKALGHLGVEARKHIGIGAIAITPDPGNLISDIVTEPKNPEKAAGIAANILLPPVLASASLFVLARIGYGPRGARGARGAISSSTAAEICEGIGGVASGSVFAVWQSAGAEGAGANIVTHSV